MPPTTKILLVDDDATVLDLVRETLEGCGYSIDTVTNSQDAIARVKDGGYSTIILDLLLPDMNGFILAQEIKRIDPGLSDRILFISGILFGQSTVDHLGSVGAGFLSKPFTDEALTRVLAAQLGGLHQGRERAGEVHDHPVHSRLRGLPAQGRSHAG